jgi:hypothetical protein
VLSLSKHSPQNMSTVRAELVEAQPFDRLRANGLANKPGRINKRLRTITKQSLCQATATKNVLDLTA